MPIQAIWRAFSYAKHGFTSKRINGFTFLCEWKKIFSGFCSSWQVCLYVRIYRAILVWPIYLKKSPTALKILVSTKDGSSELHVGKYSSKVCTRTQYLETQINNIEIVNTSLIKFYQNITGWLESYPKISTVFEKYFLASPGRAPDMSEWATLSSVSLRFWRSRRAD